MSCGVSCVKYLVFAFNLLFALTGVAILTVGAIGESFYYHYGNFVGTRIWSIPVALIIIGSLTFLISFVGCCGAAKENSCMVLTFSLILGVMILAEIGIGIVGYFTHGNLEHTLEIGFNATLADYNRNQEPWKIIQSELHCCGVNGPADWERVFANNTIPNACCDTLPVNQTACTIEYATKNGCLKALLHALENNTLILAGVSVGVALTQLLGVCYACCLYRAFRRRYETV